MVPVLLVLPFLVPILISVPVPILDSVPVSDPCTLQHKFWVERTGVSVVAVAPYYIGAIYYKLYTVYIQFKYNF